MKLRKILAVLTAVLLLMACVPLGAIPVMAATSGTTGDCTWSLNGTSLTISGNGAMADYNYLGGPWGTSITSVTIGNGVTTIGTYAFRNCTSLTSVVIPDSVTTIGDSAFAYCTSLTSVTIPDSVTAIGDSAFYDCDSLTSVTIPDSVTTIEECAFAYCDSLTSVTIGDSVITIGSEAFYSCTSLTSVTIPDSVTSIGIWAFYDCRALTAVTIPDSVTTIGKYAFYDCDSLTAVTIPDSVRTIGYGTFYYCDSLTSVTIGDSVTTIDNLAFSDCRALTSVTIPDSVTTIGDWAFDNCFALTDVYYGGSETDRAAISISSDNDALLNATWHYEVSVYQYSGSSISEDVDGLAFLFNAEVSGSKVKNGNEYVANSATVVPYEGGESYPVVRMGAILSNSGEATLDIQHADGKRVVNIEAVRLCDWSADSVSFAVRLINIPENGKDMEIFARPYYVYEVDGEEVVVYGDVVSKTYNEIA